MLSLCQYFFDIMLLQLKYVMTFFSHGYTKNISSDKGVSWEKCNIQRFSQLNFNLTCHFYTDDTISNYKDFLQQTNQRQPNQNISTSRFTDITFVNYNCFYCFNSRMFRCNIYLCCKLKVNLEKDPVATVLNLIHILIFW